MLFADQALHLLGSGFRRARNLADYEGSDVEEAKARECVECAERLLADVGAWLKKNRTDLI